MRPGEYPKPGNTNRGTRNEIAESRGNELLLCRPKSRQLESGINQILTWHGTGR
jgi:hypothetical protein